MNQQLVLHVNLRDDATFENYFPGPNQEVFSYLPKFLAGNAERFVYLWGDRDSGRTHLLQACCHIASREDLLVTYLPLAQEEDRFTPDILDSLETRSVVCIDDIDAIAGNAQWEEALFHLYNRILDSGETRLLVSAQKPPALLPIKLPDLQSRLAACVVFGLVNLTEEDKVQGVKLHAHARGLPMPDEVSRYLVRLAEGEMLQALTMLGRLESASLVKQRKVTLSFAREVLRKKVAANPF